MDAFCAAHRLHSGSPIIKGVIRARWERGQELDAKVFLQEASTINRQCHYRR